MKMLGSHSKEKVRGPMKPVISQMIIKRLIRCYLSRECQCDPRISFKKREEGLGKRDSKRIMRETWVQIGLTLRLLDRVQEMRSEAKIRQESF